MSQQQRMHPSISSIANRALYDDRLTDGPLILVPGETVQKFNKFNHDFFCKRLPHIVVNVKGSVSRQAENSFTYIRLSAAPQLVYDILHNKLVNPEDILMLTSYSARP